MLGNTLIMELTHEQGGGRETQVQPPIDVWIRFFDIDLDAPPTLEITNRRDTPPIAAFRAVVEHDHNFTIEIDGAELPRPAILRMTRTGPTAYDYWIDRPNHTEFGHDEWMLANIPNPFHRRGRRWLIL